MLTAFISKKLKTARFKRLGDGTYFGVIPGIQGVWANGKNIATCRHDLQEVLEDWLLLKLQSRERIPGFAHIGQRVAAR